MAFSKAYITAEEKEYTMNSMKRPSAGEGSAAHEKLERRKRELAERKAVAKRKSVLNRMKP